MYRETQKEKQKPHTQKPNPTTQKYGRWGKLQKSEWEHKLGLSQNKISGKSAKLQKSNEAEAQKCRGNTEKAGDYINFSF